MGFFKSLFESKSLTSEEEKVNRNFDVLKYDGMRAQNIGKFDYAEKCYREALLIHKDEEIESHLAQMLMLQGRLGDSFVEYNRLVDLYPDNIFSYLALANVCFMLDKCDEMLQACERVITLDEQNASAYYMQGKAYAKLKNNIMAIVALTKAIDLRTEYVDALLARAKVLISMEQFNDARKDVDSVLMIDVSNEDALCLKGNILQKLHSIDEAENVYRDLLSIDPFNEQAYLCLGRMLIDMDRNDEAIVLFNEAIEMNPEFAQAYKERGCAKLKKGDIEGSLQDAKKAVELKPYVADVTGQFKTQEKESINILGIDN